MNYSNPRLEAIITDWPIGGNKRGTATFRVEHRAGHGERATRTTTDPATGRTSKPRTTTYAVKVRLVTDDDGHIYAAHLTHYGHVSIMQPNLQFQAEGAIFESDPRYPAIRALFGEPA